MLYGMPHRSTYFECKKFQAQCSGYEELRKTLFETWGLLPVSVHTTELELADWLKQFKIMIVQDFV